MNDFDLEAKLKSVPMPERGEEYWEHFPTRVRMNWQRSRRESPARAARSPRLAWAGGLALVLVIGVLCVHFVVLQNASRAVTRHEKHLRTQLARLDTGLHVLMFNPHGMGYLLND